MNNTNYMNIFTQKKVVEKCQSCGSIIIKQGSHNYSCTNCNLIGASDLVTVIPVLKPIVHTIPKPPGYDFPVRHKFNLALPDMEAGE